MRAWIIGTLALCVASGAAFARATEEVRLLRSDEERVVAEILLPDPVVRPAPGYPDYQTIRLGSIASYGEPGEPELPRVGFWVAVPPGARVEISAVGQEELIWDRIRPMPAAAPEWVQEDRGEPPLFRESIEESSPVYGGSTYPASWATVGTESRLRHLPVVPIYVNPVRWDPGSGRLTVARKVRVEIRFVPTAAPDTGRPIRSEDPTWERTYNASILNAEAAQGWARRPGATVGRKRALETTDLVKLEVKTTGLRRVGYDDLESVGWPGAGAPLEELRLFERFYSSDDDPDSLTWETETPITIGDFDESGTWTPGDAFYFYAQTIYDRLPDAPMYLLRYGRRHVYWLGLRSDASNARMDATSTWLSQTLTPEASYPWTEHFEKEVDRYAKFGAGHPGREIDDEDNIRNGVASVRTKHSYWQGGEQAWIFDQGIGTRYSVRFDLPGYRSPLRFTTHFQGILRSPGGVDSHYLHFYLAAPAEDDTVRLPGTPIVIPHQDSLLYSIGAADLAGKPLREQGNYFVHLEDGRGYGAGLQWFDVSYEREPRFFEEEVQIATGDRTGPTEYLLDEVPLDLIIGVEFTDPNQPKVLTIDESVQMIGFGDNRDLKLQWNLDGSERRFWLGGAQMLPGPEEIVLDTPSDLAGPGDHDYVVIAPREWLPVLEPWVEHRESALGGEHQVLLAAIEDVYDEFAGGRHWPHAIRSFLRTLFRTRNVPPSYLMLAGDASDVFDNNLSMSDPNWVPTQTHFSTSFVSYWGRELVSSDQWFVDNLVGTGELLDFLPDMHVGRLSAGSPEELTNIVEKIISYEHFGEGESWRNRALFVSDDEWSSTITFTDRYQCNPFEEIFRDAGRWSIDLINEESGLSDFVADSFFVYAYMDTVVSLERCVIDPLTEKCKIDPLTGDIFCNPNPPSDGDLRNREYGGNVVAPLLWQQMSRGHLFVSYNGHANARLASHEFVLQHSEGIRTDVDRLTNSGRPFVFMGYGCHLAEFSSFNERNFGRADGISEAMLLAPSRGGIGAIASTGYEWLSTTHVYNLAVVRAFFQNPPQHEEHTRWVLGEVFSRSKLNLLNQSGQSDFLSMSATYTLLGDPGLIMDAAPPRMAVTVDGIPVHSGAILTLPADQDSILFEVDVRDEVWARSFAIEDAGGTVPPEAYSVVPDASDDRGFAVSYRTTLQPRPYEIALRAEDTNGRIRSTVFSVPFEANFELKRPDADWIPLDDEMLVLPEDSVRVLVDLPRFVGPSDLVILLDGAVIETWRRAGDELEDGRGSAWTLTAIEPIGRQGRRSLTLQIAQPDGGLYSVSRTIETEETFDLQALYNVPNPFADETWIVYHLGAPAEDVKIRLFTTSGKLIRTLTDLPGDPGMNRVRWDGVDEDGDQVGNGLYFYKLYLTNAAGSLTKIEKIARVR